MIDFEKIINIPTPITQIFDPIFEKKSLKVFVKRDDLTHEMVSGNKYRKLKYNLLQAKKTGFTHLLTFGGAHSNHIAAVAEAASLFGFSSKAIIRGDELTPSISPTLTLAAFKNMEFEFVTRQDYRNKSQYVEKYNTTHYIIPEGGTNRFALKGVSEMVNEILDFEFTKQTDTICLALGTGGTFAGVLSNQLYKNQVIGFPVLKGSDFLKADIETLLDEVWPRRAILMQDYHFGGYAKHTKELLDFIVDFESKFGFELEQVYTAKLFYGIFDLIKKDFFDTNQTIVIIHTGGLQGKKKAD